MLFRSYIRTCEKKVTKSRKTKKAMYFLSILLFISTIILTPITSQNQTSEPFSIHLAIIVSNKAQWIPYTFHFLDKINYPKNKISISLHSDHNFDDTINLLEIWRLKNYNSYELISLCENFQL